jgi:chaperone BCS1
MAPSLGTHWLTYKGKWCWLYRNRYTSALDFASGNFLETISITICGKNRKFIQGLIKDAMDMSFAKEEGKTVISSGSGGTWR